MKKFYLTIVLLVITVQLFAQEKDFAFGFRLGASIDWLHPNAEDYEGEGIRGGFAWGFLAEYNFTENYALQSGFNVQYLGGKLSYPEFRIYETDDGMMDSIQGLLTRTYHLQYLQIPVTFKMKTEIKENFFLFGKIGLGTGIRLKAKADDSIDPLNKLEDPYEKDKIDIKDEISFIRESLILGGGAMITLKGTTSMIVELTYDSNLFDNLLGENSVDPSIEQKGSLNFIELGVGVLF